MKILLTTTAILESATGLVLIAVPSLLTWILFDSTLDTTVAQTVARVAGVALLSLALACWFVRNDRQSNAARGLVSALLLYNTAISIVFVYAAFGLSLSGFGLLPVVLIHLALSVWCAASLLNKPLQFSDK